LTKTKRYLFIQHR